MAWRLAKSLSVLRTEILAKHPGTTVWTIGDQAHAAGYSDHNPNSAGVVCAIDVKGNAGLDLAAFVAHLIANPHPNLRYVIYRRKIYQRKNGFRAEAYRGSNAHNDHVHVSVGNGPDGRSTSNYDNTTAWGIAGSSKPSVPTSRIPAPTLRENDSGAAVATLQGSLNEVFGLDLIEDGRYGPRTTAGVKLLQRTAGIDEDGIYGPQSADALRDLLEDDMPSAFDVWSYTNEKLTKEDAYAHLRGTRADVRAIRSGQAAILAAVQGLDTEAILAAIDQAATADAERDAALLAELRDLASGGATAQEIVDQLAQRLSGGE